MSTSCTPPARTAPVALALLMALLLSGCWWWPGGRVRELSPGDVPPASEPPAGTPASADGGPSGAAASLPDAASALSGERWIRTVRGPGEKTAPEFRWRHPPLDDLLCDLPEPRPELRRLAEHTDRLVSANAAIGLARLGDATVAAKLASIVGDRRLKLPTRCAAAEALGRLNEPPALERLREAVDRHAYTPKHRNRYVVGLHAELIRALARRDDPVDGERLLAALRSPSPDVQLEALPAWEGDRPGALPVEAVDLRTARDARVRAAALRVLARRRHRKAHEHLAAALHDYDVSVRTTAIAGLGELGDEPARRTLRGLLEDRAELIRAAAVSALAAAGDRHTVFEAAGDKSWRVRHVVAEALVRYPDRKGATLARRLLDDPSSTVGPEVLDSIRRWPLAAAGPILLEAMGKRSYLIRKTAAEQLAARWAPATDFSHEAPPQRRREVLDRLTGRFRQEVGFVDRGALAAAANPAAGRTTAPVAPEQIDTVARLLRQAADAGIRPAAREEALRRLVDLGPELVPVLEELALVRKQPLPETVYREVLPECVPVFETLDRLASRDVALRRRAAAELVELSARAPLGRLAIERLASLAIAEQDPLVCRSVLVAVAADGSEPAVRIAVAALGHPSPELRRRGCEHLAANPDPRHAKVLVPALGDPSDSVVLAAVRALGAADRLDDTGPLEQLLAHKNATVRLETALALARIGSPAGTPALERLAHSGDPNVRREVAVAMGELADPALTGTLIRMLDDGHGIRRAALASLPKVAGRDVAAPGVGATPTLTEQVDAWKRWYEGHRATGPRP